MSAGGWIAIGLLLGGAVLFFLVDRAKYGRHS
jgi:hypothetical protein